MKTRMRSCLLPLLLTMLIVVFALAPAAGQRKKKETPPPPPPPPTQTVQPDTRPAQKSGGMIRDVLSKLEGQQTNLGILSKVAGDYVVFMNEGDTLMYPIGILQTVKLLKTEEGEQRKIEIRFLSKD